jgi:hypothetical protein
MAANNVVSGKVSAATFEFGIFVITVFSGPAFIASAFANREIAGPAFVAATFVEVTFAKAAFAEVAFVVAGLANGMPACATDSGLAIGPGVGAPLAACTLCGAYMAAAANEYRVDNDSLSGSELDGETEGVGIRTADA